MYISFPEGLTLIVQTMELVMFIVEHGPDQEWFNTEEEAVDAAFDWSVDLGGDTVTISRVHQGQTFPHMEVFA